MTVRRSRSPGFAAPPAPLCLSTWTMACSAEPPTGRVPFRSDTAPGLSLTLEDLVRVPVRASAPTDGGRCLRTSSLPWGSSPLRRSQHGESTSRPGVFPRGAHAARTAGMSRSYRRGSRLDGSTVPRRGVPRPLRSAFAVSHDPGGLLLPVPCGVFRPHTPVGLGAPSPRSVALRSGPRAVAGGAGGGLVMRGPPGRPERAASGPRPCLRPRVGPPLRPRQRPLRRPDPLDRPPSGSLASNPVARVSVCWPRRHGTARGIAFLASFRSTVRVLPRAATGPAGDGSSDPGPRERGPLSFDPPARATVTPLGVPAARDCQLRPPPSTVGAPEGSSGGRPADAGPEDS